jgi:hypothetical protein
MEDLVEKAKEGAADVVDPITAVGAFVGLGQEPRGQERAEELLEVEEAFLAQLLDALAQGRQAGAQLREEGCIHKGGIYTALLTRRLHFHSMKKEKSAPASLSSWETEYERLRRSLCGLGWISEGYVQDRGPGAGGPCYQWTRKVRGKTLSVALSREQYEWLRQAIENWRQVQATLKAMQRLSRQVLFATVPHPPRRKRLSKKVLGLI